MHVPTRPCTCGVCECVASTLACAIPACRQHTRATSPHLVENARALELEAAPSVSDDLEKDEIKGARTRAWFDRHDTTKQDLREAGQREATNSAGSWQPGR